MKLPYLYLWLDCWLVQVGTELMHERYEFLCREYIGLRITLCHRWGFHVRLYSPHSWPR